MTQQEFRKFIAEKLKEMRTMSNVTQQDMALLLGVKQPTISEYESGKNITIDTLCKYAEVLNISVDILLKKIK